MGNDITKHIRPLRLGALPEDMRLALKDAREKRGWTQRDLASRLGLTQTHISGIESGKIAFTCPADIGETFTLCFCFP